MHLAPMALSVLGLAIGGSPQKASSEPCVPDPSLSHLLGDRAAQGDTRLGCGSSSLRPGVPCSPVLPEALAPGWWHPLSVPICLLSVLSGKAGAWLKLASGTWHLEDSVDSYFSLCYFWFALHCFQ